MRTPWLRTLAVALTLTLVVTGLAVLPAPPARAGSVAPQTTTAPPSAGKPGLVDRMKGLLGIGKPADDSRSLALPRRQAAPVGKRLPPAKRVRELSARRRANSKLFKLADGRVQAELSSAPVHYRDRQGNWQDIDTRVAASASRPGYAYGNQTNAFGSFFGTSSQRLVRVQLGARAVGLGLAEAGRPLSPRVKGDQVTYRDAAAGGADLTYQVTPGALKEQLVLDRPPADPTWTFTLDLEGLVARPRQDGSIALHDNSGKGQPLLVMPRPFMTDSAADPSSPYGKAWSDKVTQTVTQQGSRLRLTVRADRAWLASPQRKYPVVIDPTIKLQPPVSSAQDVMVSSEAPSSNLDGNWRLGVGTTPGGVYRSLLRFPLDQVPPGTQVQAAELMTYFDQAHTTNDQAVTISAHRATSAWDEATATWANASSNVGEQGRTSPWVDDGELEKTAAEGEWVLASDPNAQVGDYRYNQNATTGESYTWVPSVVVDGDYSVQVHHVAGADRATAAPYTVTHANRTTSYTVNQSAGTGGVWTTLGSHRFTPGTSGRIRLGDVADPSKKVVADAVRLVMPATQVKAAKQASRWHSFQVTSIVQKWLDGTEPNHGFVLKATDEATLGRGGPLYEAAEYAYTGGELAANFPKLVVTYGLPGVQLKPVTTVHATGAELEWTPYVDPSPKEGDDIVEYRVHRSNYQNFTPSPANRLATVPANQTAFVDTAATPTPADSADPMGKAYYYMVAVKTKGGQVIYGTQERVRLPRPGGWSRSSRATPPTPP